MIPSKLDFYFKDMIYFQAIRIYYIYICIFTYITYIYIYIYNIYTYVYIYIYAYIKLNVSNYKIHSACRSYIK